MGNDVNDTLVYRLDHLLIKLSQGEKLGLTGLTRFDVDLPAGSYLQLREYLLPFPDKLLNLI